MASVALAWSDTSRWETAASLPGDHKVAIQPARLIQAAIKAGRMRGEPAVILKPRASRSFLTRMLGARVPGPLADPRLEVLRAISAALAGGIAQIGGELAVAAKQVGWTPEDLRRIFPGVVIRGLQR
jgi:hypothetical protein